MNKKRNIRIALAGNPNSGKSTLFNALTGLNQKVGNYPGITVEKRVGRCNINEDYDADIIDLPGTYSIFPKSIDERITQQVLCDQLNDLQPDIAIVIADATNLRRSLLLLSQLIDMKKKTILALNMVDLALRRGIIVDVGLLSSKLGIEVVAINARNREGIDNLKSKIPYVIQNNSDQDFLDIKTVFPNIIDAANEWNNNSNDYTSFLLLCRQDLNCETKNRIGLDGLYNKFNFVPERAQAKEIVRRYKKIDEIVHQCTREGNPKGKHLLTKKIDNILMHPVLGYFIFLSILFLIFQAVFSWSEYPMEIIDSLFTTISDWVSSVLPSGMLNDLIVKGVLAGLAGIMIFIPQIAFLFAFIVLLEDTGYMARVSFITDKFLKKVGLNGRSVIPLLSGIACAVPAIMSARTIPGWKERLITIMVTPLMSCAARLPVYILIISVMISEEAAIGPFNLQGLIMMSFYLIGFLATILSAFVFKHILKSKKRSYYIMELPSYKIPDWKTVLYTIFEKLKVFIFDAGKVIVMISIILWALSSYGPKKEFQKIEAKWEHHQDANLHIASEKLEASYAGILGKSIEPIIKPLGFDWKIGIALITSFAAREVFVGTMSTIYSVQDGGSIYSVRERLLNVRNSETGQMFFTPAVSISLMLFYAFAMQCMSTLAIVYRETNRWKWPIIQFVYMGCLAYISSFIAFQLLS
ncbi:MAG: ferrous iron transport protein B [Bacteroidota bacterium]|nr:ferrous iron transport protein B [Bacteroidota bacterium]